jgi:hypothetical protein
VPGCGAGAVSALVRRGCGERRGAVSAGVRRGCGGAGG